MPERIDDRLEFVRRAFRAATGAVLRVCDLDVLERDASAPIPADHSAPALEYRRCTHEDLDAFRALGPRWPLFQRTFDARLSRGQICFGCFDGPRAVGYVWVSSAPERDPAMGLRIRPARDEMYGFDLFVTPEYRRLSVGHSLIRRWLLEARAQNRPRAVGIILSTNRPMQMLTRTGFGFRRVHRIRTAQIGRRFGLVLRGRAEGLT